MNMPIDQATFARAMDGVWCFYSLDGRKRRRWARPSVGRSQNVEQFGAPIETPNASRCGVRWVMVVDAQVLDIFWMPPPLHLTAFGPWEDGSDNSRRGQCS
jgi:hypothetical protein